MSSATLGGIYLLLFFGGLGWLFFWSMKKFGPGVAMRQRERQLETEINRAQADERIIEQIMRRKMQERD